MRTVEAVVFDVVGTLVDEEAAFAAASQSVATAVGMSTAANLQGLWTERVAERMAAVVDGSAPWQPHRELVVAAADEAVVRLGRTPTPASRSIASSLDRTYRAWSDSAAATHGLAHDRVVACISNADLDALAHLAATNDLRWHAAMSAAAVHTFKPASAVYDYAINTLRIDPARCLFVASHPWDLRAASRHGFNTAYVARPGAQRPAAGDHFDLEIDTLTDLPDLLV